MVIGLVLVAVGIWGFFSEPILGIFTVNTLQNIVHIAVGALAIFFASKAFFTKIVLGYGFLVLGVLGFIPGVKEVLASLLLINTADNILHLVIGVVSVGLAHGHKEEEEH